MKISNLILGLIIALVMTLIPGCRAMENHEITHSQLPVAERMDHLRPSLHFTPPSDWMNDPNGMVYYAGEYHLFYQHYPDDTVWGPMHWGHAVSTDLVNWEHLPIALHPDELGYIFSGSAIIDWDNSAGFGEEAMIAFYTYHNPENDRQSQAMAYSTDKGRSWTKYKGNPIIPTPPNIRNFRDPKVFWYDAENGSGHWVMLIAAGTSILFYTSPDLKNWEPSSGFGFGQGSTSGVWETPDLFELPFGDSDETRWVLTVGLGNHAPAGGSGMQYFVGSFDGKEFTNANPKDMVLWADYGADFYAAQSWSDVPNGRRIWLAWMNNWEYATVTPTPTWRGAMSLPREVRLVDTPSGLRMAQTPAVELTALRGELFSAQEILVSPNLPFQPDIDGEIFEIIATFKPNTDADQFGLRIYTAKDEFFTVGYNPISKHLFTDRTQSGQTDFHDQFAKVHLAEHLPAEGTIHFHIIVDNSAIEIYVDHGLVTFSERIFPTEGSPSLEFFTQNADVTLKQVDIYSLNPAEFILPETNEQE